MPELPEVETVRRGLDRVMTGEKITGIDLRRKDLRIPFPKTLPGITGARVTAIERRAKYLLLRLSTGDTMIVHLGMSGRMVIHAKDKRPKAGKHDHMILRLGNDAAVFFNDARRFGLVDLVKTAQAETHRFFRHLGPEPLEKEFSAAYLAGKAKGKKPSIKVFIMDQRVVVGVGNIYAAEALYEAGISPLRAAGKVTPEEFRKLAPAIKKVLKKAIAQGGSSLKDYVQADGALGYFQHHWAVYGQAGKLCRRCRTPIEKITQGGRSTFHCPHCQK